VQTVTLGSCGSTSNTVSLGDSKYCNISLTAANSSQINIFENTNAGFLHTGCNIDFEVVKKSKIMCSGNRVYLVAEGSRLLSIDLEDQSTEHLFYFPETADENPAKEPFLIQGSCSTAHPEIICVYGVNWLTIGDLRTKGLVATSELLSCQSAFSTTNSGVPKTYFSQNNLLREFELRKIAGKLDPVLAHEYPIENCYEIMREVIGIQSCEFPGVSLYATGGSCF
jgi:hypothetical protein